MHASLNPCFQLHQDCFLATDLRWFVTMAFPPIAMVWSHDPCSIVALETICLRIFYDLMAELGQVWDDLNKHFLQVVE